VTAAALGRLTFLLTACGLWRLGDGKPAAALVLVIGTVMLFYAADAIVAVPWFELVARSIPPTRRGRLFGLSQVVGGLGGIGIGAFVGYALGESSRWSFPDNYAVLFLAAAAVLLVSVIFLSLVREAPAPAEAEETPSPTQVLRQLPTILAADPPFLRLIITRLAIGFVSVASAFYVLHATQRLGLGSKVAGYFVSAQVTGSLIGGLLTTFLQDRRGPLVHMRVVISLSGLPALVALGMQPLHALLGSAILYPYLLVFLFLGVYAGSSGWPFFNWTLEYADKAKRPLYVGLINTLGAISTLAPPLGGWVAGSVSYPAVFALAVAFAVAAWLLARKLPSTR
jgi:MFS family permease